MQDEHVIEIWTTLKDFIPVKHREEAALQYIQLMDEAGLELRELAGHDVYLDKIIAEKCEHDDEDMELDYG